MNRAGRSQALPCKRVASLRSFDGRDGSRRDGPNNSSFAVMVAHSVKLFPPYERFPYMTRSFETSQTRSVRNSFSAAGMRVSVMTVCVRKWHRSVHVGFRETPPAHRPLSDAICLSNGPCRHIARAEKARQMQKRSIATVVRRYSSRQIGLCDRPAPTRRSPALLAAPAKKAGIYMTLAVIGSGYVGPVVRACLASTGNAIILVAINAK